MKPSEIKRIRTEPKKYTVNRNYSQKKEYIVKKNKSLTEVKRKRRILPQDPTTAYIFDSGAYMIKAGNSNFNGPWLIPNCITKAKSERKRPFIGDQLKECRDLSGLFYLLPCEKGYITKWDVQKPIWDYVFQNAPIEDHPLIMTQPLFNFRSIQECIDEIFFEEYDVKSMFRTCTSDLAQYEYIQKVMHKDLDCIVVDTGYSYTHIVPYINGLKYFPGIKRIDIGGKLLTNYLKDIISYRQLHVMEETYVINQVKEDTCFVSLDLKKDMKTALSAAEDNSIVKNYVLPDFNNIRRGYIQDPEDKSKEFLEGCQILRLNNERFTVPELLLRPSNIGMDSKGIAEAIVQTIYECPTEKQPILSDNIILIGGNANFPGLKERIYKDVRALSSCYWRINVYKPNDPVTFTWTGGKSLASNPYLHTLLVSKREYEEHGSNYTYKKYNNIKYSKRIQPIIEEKKPPVESQYAHLYNTSSFVFGKCKEGEKEKFEEFQRKYSYKTPGTVQAIIQENALKIMRERNQTIQDITKEPEVIKMDLCKREQLQALATKQSEIEEKTNSKSIDGEIWNLSMMGRLKLKFW